jgi:hypothetical protein
MAKMIAVNRVAGCRLRGKRVVYPKNSRHCKLSTFFLKMWPVSQRLRDLLLLLWWLAMDNYGPVKCAQPQSFEHHHDMDVAR